MGFAYQRINPLHPKDECAQLEKSTVVGGSQENVILFPPCLPPPSVVFSHISFPSLGIRLLIKC